MRESEIQTEIKKHLEANGWQVIKLTLEYFKKDYSVNRSQSKAA